MDNLLIRFLLPSFDGTIHALLQITFAIVFAAVLIVTPRLVARTARSENWESRFAHLDSANDSVPAYGATEELSNAVATPAERWADILPSLLLVFGLLGTFIGLGLALTEAAGVLGVNKDDLNGLTPIMDSLGSKFKTSTWGILAFLSLKVWFMLRPYEEQRLAWAAQKIKARSAIAAEQERQKQLDERRLLIDTIVQSGAALRTEQASTLSVLKQFTEQQMQADRAQQEVAGHQLQTLNELTMHLVAAAQQQTTLVDRAGEIALNGTHQIKQAESQLQHMAIVAKHAEASRTAMEGFVGSVSGNIQTMAVAADSMAAAADSAGKASVDLGAAIGDFRRTMIGTLDEVKTGLGYTIDGMRDTFASNMQTMAENLTSATDGIRDAISQLSTGVSGTIEALEKANQESIKRQTTAQATFTASGDKLMESMGTMQSFVELMQDRTEAGLRSVATAGQQMMGFDKRFAESNEQVKQLVSRIETLANGILTTSQNLLAVETLSDELACVVDRIKEQQLDERVPDTLARIEVTIRDIARPAARARADVENIHA